MSNEYKDWERDKIEEEKEIVAKYPFLRIRNTDGMPDMDAKFPLMSLEIPDGWYKLFFQMCDDIKPILKEEGILEDFYFIQVKEKYNMLRCYSCGKASYKVEDIIGKYEEMARYICTNCGRPATVETKDYIASFCDDCWKDNFRHEKIEWIKFQPYFVVNTFTAGTHCDEKYISFKDEWERYISALT